MREVLKMSQLLPKHITDTSIISSKLFANCLLNETTLKFNKKHVRKMKNSQLFDSIRQTLLSDDETLDLPIHTEEKGRKKSLFFKFRLV